MTALAFCDAESHFAGLPAGAVSQVDLRGSSENLQRPPAFVIGGMSPELSYTLFAELQTGPVRLYTLKDGRVTLDGIVLHGSTALHSWLFNHPDYHVRELLTGALGGQLALPVRRIEERAVMLSGPGYSIYGHWIIDILPRLWVLHAAGVDLTSLKFILPVQQPPFAIELLALFGIGEHQLVRFDERQEILEVAELLLPTNLRRGNRLDSLMVHARAFLLERIRPSLRVCSAAQEPLVFVTRRNADPSRTLVNRDRAEEIAQQAGYKIVDPAQMSIAEQIVLFQGARSLMGEYGSGLHNSLFAGSKTSLCVIRSSSVHPGFMQSALTDVCRQAIGYVLCPSDIWAVDQTFEVSEQALTHAVRCMALLREQ